MATRQYSIGGSQFPLYINETGTNQYAAFDVFINETSNIPPPSFGWFSAMSEPSVKARSGLRSAAHQAYAAPPAIIVSFGWDALLSEPVRVKPRLLEANQQFLAYHPAPSPFVATGWYEPISEPTVKSKLRLRDGDQQFLAMQPMPSPFVATGWFEWLSEPKRFKQGLPAPDQQTLAFNPVSPLTVTPFAWYANLTEPVRQKRGLRADLQQPFATDETTIQLNKLIEWLVPYAEPVRQKPGLDVRLQQFFTLPSRIIPTPTALDSVGTMFAIESFDAFLAGLRDYSAVTGADVSVREILRYLSPVGIFEATRKSANIGLQASLPITTSGSAISQTYTARVAIREV